MNDSAEVHHQYACFDGPIAAAFTRHAALQCGFCTPGMVLTIHALLEDGELTDEPSIRHGLAGNLCRCTGYRAILDAVSELASERAPWEPIAR